MESKNYHILNGARLANAPPGEEVVISGLAGMYPESKNVQVFSEKLFNKEDLLTDDDRRWKSDHPEIPQRSGKIYDINKFDAGYFGIHYKQVHTMDPMSRLIMEKTIEAILDAGINPKEMKGKKCGVFLGMCFSESEKTWFYERIQVHGFGITGSARSMMHTRIAALLGIHGPTFTIDSACSSSLFALEEGYKAIRNGECESAIVCGVNLTLHPSVTLQFARLGVLSIDGKCKSFDEAANGYCRSEACAVVFLQKSKDARRVYAKIIHAKTNCDGFKEQGITYPSGKMQYELLKDFYVECGVDPTTINFIEAHGTGTRVGDPEECNALDPIFCTGRKEPLLIGSVKSSIGHSEPSSGLCSVTKVIIAMENGTIPPNINFKSPRHGIPAFVHGRMKVVTEKTPLTNGLIGINSFGFGGANCHVLLEWNKKEKINNGLPQDNIPRLVCVSGRSEEAVKSILDDLESRNVDVEYIKLYHDLFSQNIPGHPYRGFTVYTNTDRKIRDIKFVQSEERPIWFVFSGLGSQWPGMGKALLKIPVFAKAIDRCEKALKTKGVDLIRIFTEDEPKVFDNILNIFVGITAIQVGLVDILHALGIYPDKIIGHSIGELGCAYADGCLTAEQAVLAAYSRGLAVLEIDFFKATLAAVGMGYHQMKHMLPPEVVVAGHNGPASCWVTGPTDVVKKFLSELSVQGIFVREIQSSNIPFHSRFSSKMRPKLLEYLKKVIPAPKPRSDKWICTSLPKQHWQSNLAKFASAEYFTNNLLSPVFFEEGCSGVPPNAITIEIAPHGSLQAILKRSFDKGTTNIALTQRGHADNSQVLMTGIGKLYEAGIDPKLANLYPPVEYPVSRGTPMISPLIKWRHDDDWFVTSFRMHEIIRYGERNVLVSLNKDETEFIAGHLVDGRNLYPATGYLALVWETAAMLEGDELKFRPVVFENVKFLRATNIPKEGFVDFTILVQKGTGNFEIVESNAAIVTGNVRLSEDISKDVVDLPELKPDIGPEKPEMNMRDIYKELRLRGYQYQGLFKSLVSMDNSGRTGKIRWHNNWVAFMDNILQTQILQEDTRKLYVPTSIARMTIDPIKHSQLVKAEADNNEDILIPFNVYKEMEILKAGGVEIRSLNASQIPRRKVLAEPVLEKYNFVPHTAKPKKEPLNLLETIRMCCHLALENVPGVKVKVTELGQDLIKPESEYLAPLIASVLGDLPLIQAEITLLSPSKTEDIGTGFNIEERKLAPDQSCLLVFGNNLLQKRDLLELSFGAIKDNGFVVTRENINNQLLLDGLTVLIDQEIDNERLLMFRKEQIQNETPIVIKIKEKDNFKWVPTVQEALKTNPDKEIILVAENEPFNGLIGFTNCLRKEPGGENVRCVYINDKNAPPFSLTHPLYSVQLNKKLATNVYKDGQWGCLHHQALPDIKTVEAQHVYLNTLVRGDLSSFRWFEGPINSRRDKNTEVIYVYFASVNFRDVMLSTAKLSTDVVARGRLKQDLVTGFEFAGRTADGRRVMGMVDSGAMASEIPSGVDTLYDVPDSWSLEDAATVCVVYGTSWLALVENGKLQKGESVLIHSGTGGVGLAAIYIATHFGCNVFTTVGTPEKREYIKKLFPQIPESNIGNSRDTSFEQMIRRETNGRGVDVVLNSLAEEKLQASIRCLARGGRFLEIGKFDMSNNNPLVLEMFLEEKSFHGVMLDTLFDTTWEHRYEFNIMMKTALTSGAITPLNRTVFKMDEVEQAFRYMTTGKHIGKVLIKIRDEEEQKIFVPKEPQQFTAIPRMFCHPGKTFIIAGGLGGFGIELADWLAVRGARRIVLTSRKGIRNGYQAQRIRLWREYGAQVVVSTEDITTEDGVRNLLNEANKLGPIFAIYNLAVVLKDAIFENQTEDNFKESFGPKAVATQYLDSISRELCPELQQFVIFSSVSCGRGNAGQTNYGMANSVMERIIENRKLSGLPALAIQWGAIGDVGLVADMQEDHQELVIGGTLQQSIESCLACMDYFLKQNHPVVGSMVVAEKRAGASSGGSMVDVVVNIMGLRDIKTVSMHSSLAELGMDSMMAVEIKQTLEREFEVYLTPQDIRGLTFGKLTEMAANQSDTPADTKDAPDPSKLQGLAWLMQLISEESVARLKYVQMATKAPSQIIKPDNPPFFFFPGLEGQATAMQQLAEELRFPVIALQYPFDDPLDSLEDLVGQLVPIIKSNLPKGTPFNLLAHSVGTLIATEVAHELENAGYTGRVYLLDGSTEFIQTLAHISMGDTGDENMQVKLLVAVMDTILPSGGTRVQEELEKCKTWDEKLQLCLSLKRDDLLHSNEYLRKLFTSLYHRMKAIMKYKYQHINKIRSEVMLIRPKMKILSQMPDDYNLSQICEDTVKVHFVDGTHVTMLKDQTIPELLNETAVPVPGKQLNILDTEKENTSRATLGVRSH